MEKPNITPWNEDKKGEIETFKVAESIRIALPNTPVKIYAVGEEIKISGGLKKDLYFRNKIFYPKDFDSVKKYEKEMKEKFAKAPDDLRNIPAAGNKDVATLKKANSDLQKQFDELSAQFAALTKK